MTTSTHSPAGETSARGTVAGWLRAGRAALDKPATSYYLVFGSAALLLTLGLVMVLSASSVWSMQTSDNHSPYSIFLRQAIWVAVGLVLALAASRMPLWLLRRLAYSACCWRSCCWRPRSCRISA